MNRRRRRLFLLVLSLTVAAGMIGIFTWVRARAKTGTTSTAASTRPRIKRVVLITVDTLRADVLACYGNSSMVTASLAGLARNAVLFEQAVAPSPWTRPSIASLHTGLPPKAHGATAQEIEVEAVLPKSVPTLAELMRDAGYQTAGMGYNAFIAFSPNFKRGFRQFAFFPRTVSDSEGKTIPVAGNVGDLKLHGASLEEVQTAVDTIGTTPVLTQLAIQWLTDHAQDDFFLWLHYFDPHIPYTPPRDYFCGRVAPLFVSDKDYEAWALKLSRTLDAYLETQRKILRGTATAQEIQGNAEVKVVLEQQQQALRKLYEAEVEFVDQAIGEVLRTLDRLGLYDDTLLIVTSDHGEEFWDHENLEHGHSLKQELLHVPLLIKPPRHRGAVRVRERVSIQSLLSTVLDLCSIPPPAGPGHRPSLASTWERPGSPASPASRPPFFAEGILYGKPKGAVIFGDMKYIREYAGGDEQLYDLAADPHELTSLASAAPPELEVGRSLLEKRNLAIGALRKAIWTSGLRTKTLNEAQRKALRSHGYIK